MLSQYLILAFLGTVLPTIFAGFVLFDPTRAYARWAKTAATTAALAGMAWGVFGYAVDHHWYAIKYVYFELLCLKHTCGGLVLGIIFSISIARPYEKIGSEDTERHAYR